MIDQLLKFGLILSHSASLVKFGECSYEVIKTTRAKLLQKDLVESCPLWCFVSLYVPMEPLKGFMFQMKGCEWDFIDIKYVMQTKILFFPVNPSSWIITIKVRKIKIWPSKIVGRREPNVCRRIWMLSIVHG